MLSNDNARLSRSYEQIFQCIQRSDEEYMLQSRMKKIIPFGNSEPLMSQIEICERANDDAFIYFSTCKSSTPLDIVYYIYGYFLDQITLFNSFGSFNIDSHLGSIIEKNGSFYWGDLGLSSFERNTTGASMYLVRGAISKTLNFFQDLVIRCGHPVWMHYFMDAISYLIESNKFALTWEYFENIMNVISDSIGTFPNDFQQQLYLLIGAQIYYKIDKFYTVVADLERELDIQGRVLATLRQELDRELATQRQELATLRQEFDRELATFRQEFDRELAKFEQKLDELLSRKSNKPEL